MDDFSEQYTALADHYDELTFDVDYKDYALFADRLFKKKKIPGKLILDAACGTGSLSVELSKLGYEMISSDISPEMLSAAQRKCEGMENPPVFICQDMTELDLYGTVDGCVCCLDSINYLTELWQLKRAFKRISEFMNDGGLFIFDVKSVGMFKEMDGICSAWEEDGLFAVWQYGYDKKSMRAMHIVDIFENNSGLYKRYSETHYQRAYSVQKLTELLEANDFTLAGVYSDRRLKPFKSETGRLYFAAVRNRRK